MFAISLNLMKNEGQKAQSFLLFRLKMQLHKTKKQNIKLQPICLFVNKMDAGNRNRLVSAFLFNNKIFKQYLFIFFKIQRLLL